MISWNRQRKIRCAQNGILFEKKIDFGDPGSKIIQFAKVLNFDMIIIGRNRYEQH
jgi:nucleotide-binding universal stress UspA family protein